MRTGRWLHGHMQCAFPMTNSDWSSSPSVVSMVRCGLFNSPLQTVSPRLVPAAQPMLPVPLAARSFYLFPAQSTQSHVLDCLFGVGLQASSPVRCTLQNQPGRRSRRTPSRHLVFARSRTAGSVDGRNNRFDLTRIIAPLYQPNPPCQTLLILNMPKHLRI